MYFARVKYTEKNRIAPLREAAASEEKIPSLMPRVFVLLHNRMASRKTRQNHSIQHLLELPPNRESKLPGFPAEEHTQSPPSMPTPRQVPVTVLHPSPKKVSGPRIYHAVIIRRRLSLSRGGRVIRMKFAWNRASMRHRDDNLKPCEMIESLNNRTSREKIVLLFLSFLFFFFFFSKNDTIIVVTRKMIIEASVRRIRRVGKFEMIFEEISFVQH